MPGRQIIALIAGGAGLLIGALLARSSHRSSPLLTTFGHFFHYLASAAVAAVPLAVISGAVLADFKSGVTVAASSLAAALVLVGAHAVPESLARRSRSDLAGGLFRLAWDRWVTIAKPIGDFNATLLLGLFYFTLMLPFGAASRLFSDRLRLKKVPEGEPLWLARERPTELTLDEARRQF